MLDTVLAMARSWLLTVRDRRRTELIDVDEVEGLDGGESEADLTANGDGRMRGYLRMEAATRGAGPMPTLHFHENGELDAFLDAIKQPVQAELTALWKEGVCRSMSCRGTTAGGLLIVTMSQSGGGDQLSANLKKGLDWIEKAIAQSPPRPSAPTNRKDPAADVRSIHQSVQRGKGRMKFVLHHTQEFERVQRACEALYEEYEWAEEAYVGPDYEQVFMDHDGRIKDPDVFRRSVFYHGVDPHVRASVWKFLLAYYPYDSTRDERDAIAEERR